MMRKHIPRRSDSSDAGNDHYAQLLIELHQAIEAVRFDARHGDESATLAYLTRIIEMIDDTLSLLVHYHLQHAERIDLLDRLLHDLEERERAVEVLVGEERGRLQTRFVDELNRWISTIELEIKRGDHSSG